MSKGLNSAQLIGSLGADPEMRYTANGAAVANFNVATDSGWKDKVTGEHQSKTEWHRCCAFGKLAEIVGSYLKKGSKVYVQGRIQPRQREKDGITRYSTEIVASEVIMLDSKGNAEQPKDFADKPETGNNTAGDGFHDDIPFAPVDWRAS